jgi:7-keto-8-aminopelargonate synthetase-like enzyme
MNRWLSDRVAQGLEHKRTEAGIRSLKCSQDYTLNLATNDYLDLAHHPKVIEAATGALARYGSSTSGSPVVNGYLPIHQQLEESFKAWLEYPSCLVWNSGYSANHNLLSLLPRKGDLVLADRHMHVSALAGVLQSGARLLRYHHNDTGHLEKLLSDNADRNIFVLTESLFSMDGDWPDLRAIAALKNKHDFFWIVDEAHAIGWYGKGLCAQAGVAEAVDALVTTLGKAFVSQGAISLFRDPNIREYLLNFSKEFMYTTYPAPAGIAASIQAVELVRAELLQQQAEWLSLATEIRRLLGLDHPYDSPIIPFIVGDNASVVELGKRFNQAGIRVGVIRPPSVAEGTARLRISINRNLSMEAFESKVLPIIHQFKAENSLVDGFKESQAPHV